MLSAGGPDGPFHGRTRVRIGTANLGAVDARPQVRDPNGELPGFPPLGARPYTIWVVPKIISMLVLEKGISINSRGFEGVCISLTCGSLLHALVVSVAFSIQQLPIPTLLGIEDNTAGYFIGWLIAFFLLPVIVYSLNKIVNKKYESAPMLGTNLS